MKHLLFILILIGFMSVANAGWFFTSDEEYIENCADGEMIARLESDIQWHNDQIQNIQKRLKQIQNKSEAEKSSQEFFFWR